MCIIRTKQNPKKSEKTIVTLIHECTCISLTHMVAKFPFSIMFTVRGTLNVNIL